MLKLFLCRACNCTRSYSIVYTCIFLIYQWSRKIETESESRLYASRRLKNNEKKVWCANGEQNRVLQFINECRFHTTFFLSLHPPRVLLTFLFSQFPYRFLLLFLFLFSRSSFPLARTLASRNSVKLRKRSNRGTMERSLPIPGPRRRAREKKREEHCPTRGRSRQFYASGDVYTDPSFSPNSLTINEKKIRCEK